MFPDVGRFVAVACCPHYPHSPVTTLFVPTVVMLITEPEDGPESCLPEGSVFHSRSTPEQSPLNFGDIALTRGT